MPLAVACGWLERAGLGVLGLKLRMWSSSAQQFHSNPPEVHTHHSHRDSDDDNLIMMVIVIVMMIVR